MPLTLPQSFSDLHAYTHAILKRRWTVLLCIALTVIFTAVQLSGRVPLYTTSAKVLLGYQPAKVLDVQEVLQRFPYQPGGGQDTSSMTQFALLSSRLLAERVIRKLHLEERPNVFSKGKTLKYRIGSLFPEAQRKAIKNFFRIGKKNTEDTQDITGQDAKKRSLEPLINGYLTSLSVRPATGNLIEVRLTGNDPKEITRILNTHLEEFIRLDLELKFAPSEEAQKWIEDKLQEAKREMDNARLKLLQYADEHGLDQALPERADLPLDSRALSELGNYPNEVKLIKIKLKNLIELARKVSDDPSAIMLTLPPQDFPSEALLSIRTMMDSLSRLKIDYANQSTQYGPEHPKMVQMMNLINDLEKTIKAEARRLVRNFELLYAHYDAIDKDVSALVEPMKEKTKALARAIPEFEMLKIESKARQEIYNQIQEKLNTIRLLGTMPSEELASTIKIIDKPEVPRVAMGTNKIKKISYAGLMGLFIGIALSLFFEFLDKVIRTPLDIQRFFKVPFLGPFPRVVAPDTTIRDNDLDQLFVTVSDPSSVEAEAIRNIRTNIIFSFAGRKNHALVITSPLPSEGKSTVVSNLAASMAQLGKKTLIIEADLRRPTLHHIFRIQHRRGLSDVLIGELDLNAAIRSTKVPYLEVIPCGTIPPNPSELLGSDAMAEILAELKQRYEIVLLDSPPVHAVMDSLVVSRHTDGIVLVTRAGLSTLPATREAIKKCETWNPRLLGIILNDFSPVGEYYSRYHYYGIQSETQEEESVSLPV